MGSVVTCQNRDGIRNIANLPSVVEDIVAMAGVAAMRLPSATLTLLTNRSQKQRSLLCITSAFSSSSSTSSPSKARKLILYSKPGCCLCDGLKEKLHAAFLLSGPDSLHDVDLQVRDITSNPEWERAYQYEIPVLASVLSDGTEETLPRLSPRLGVELIQKKIASVLKQ
ncbi:hypothetical protein HS088_TW06G01014 [Tripterygium wilfordii]|uniref:Glutaredoxin-like protein n=1 Tax=Tripterygium wilfordii TaxID=458696 RepID=A0A7J7DKP3_TRIWF|nr:uncharacterized protein LOC120000715 [Tripterygium wilfordii]KAF5746839.1 hypothetical protein HS088_TW06G01014 [Tripterygium wilfordii]